MADMTVDESGTANPAGPRIGVTSITLTAARPRVLADFYARLTGWRLMESYPAREGEPPEAGWAQVKPPQGAPGPTLNFEWDRHFAVPTWPSEPGRQTASEHLDLRCEDLQAAVAWAEQCGARLADHQPQEHVRVMLDPDGHPFCVFR